MKFISAAALLAFSVSVVSAADAGILFNSPLTGTVWTAGSTGLLTWTSDDSSITTIPSIDLKQGPSTALQPVLNIGVNIPVSSSPYTWNIPANLPAGNDYAITAGVSPNISYTGTITIQAAAGGAASSGAASSGSASASAASSSAPVSSAPATSSAPASTSAAATTAASSAPASSSAAAASSSAAPATTSKSGSNSLKASLVGAGLAAGAAALLL